MCTVALVSGATQGIGRATAEVIAKSFPDCGVVLLCRDLKRGDTAATEIKEATSNPSVWSEVCDVSDWSQVHETQKRLEAKSVKIWLLVNNAAECPLTQDFVQRRNKSGNDLLLDKQFSTNVLGYHFLMSAFLRKPFTTDSALCINVASNWAGDLDLRDLNFTSRSYDPDTAYRQSKQANRMLSQEWAEKLGRKYTVVSCHPGDPCTKLSTALGYNLYASKECKGVVEKNILSLVKSKDLVSGGWYEGGRPSRCQFSSPSLANDRTKLFELCDEFVVS